MKRQREKKEKRLNSSGRLGSSCPFFVAGPSICFFSSLGGGSSVISLEPTAPPWSSNPESAATSSSPCRCCGLRPGLGCRPARIECTLSGVLVTTARAAALRRIWPPPSPWDPSMVTSGLWEGGGGGGGGAGGGGAAAAEAIVPFSRSKVVKPKSADQNEENNLSPPRKKRTSSCSSCCFSGPAVALFLFGLEVKKRKRTART